MTTTIDLYFDFISPYAYLGWHAIKPIAAARSVEVRPLPSLFIAMLKKHGQLGPGEMPEKRAYIFKDASRRAHDLGRPLVPPPAHPFRNLPAMRSVGCVEPGERPKLIDALFDVAWGGDRHPEGGLESPVVVERALSAAGFAGAALVAEAQEQPAKDRLRHQTEAALDRGVFGVPTFVVEREGTSELFWGTDALPFLERYLDGDDPLSAPERRQAVAAWREQPTPVDRRVASPTATSDERKKTGAG